MTYKEAREYLIPIAANCVLPQYAAALEKAMEALELAESVVRCKDCKQYGGVAFGNVCRRWSAPLAGMKNCTKPDDFCSYAERRADNG